MLLNSINPTFASKAYIINQIDIPLSKELLYYFAKKARNGAGFIIEL